MKKKIGTMIKEIAAEKHFHFSALGRGLCTKSALSKYLNGTLRIDRLLLTVLLQRIGKSPLQFTILLTKEEYTYFEWKQRICVAHKNKDWKLVELLLQEKIASDRSCNEVLQAQFEEIMRAVVVEKVYQKTAESAQLLEKAINRTVPNFQKGLKSDTLLGTQEINAILLWQRLQSDKMISARILMELMQYLERNYQDMKEFSKIYPLVAAQYLNHLREQANYAACLTMTEKVLDTMIATGYVFGLDHVLNIYVESAEHLGIRDMANKRKKQLQAWQELMQEINPNEDNMDDELFMLDVWQEIELVNEAISVSRREQGYSQERLSEEICTPETMSRIENGWQTPHNRNYIAFAKKLSLPEEQYFSTIVTDDFEVLELQSQLEMLIMGKDWQEANKIFLQLQEILDVDEKKNQQYLESMRFNLEVANNRIAKEERMVRAVSILMITIPQVKVGSWKEEWFWEHYFTSREMSILIQIADELFMADKKAEEAQLLENMLNYYKKSKIHYDYHYRIVLLVITRLAVVYSDLSDYKKTMTYIEEGIRMCFASGSKKLLPSLINNMADTLECLGRKEASLKYYRLAYYCGDLMKLKTTEISKRSYEKLLGKTIVWY